MNNKLQGKKLLILGGNAISCEIVTAARKLNVYTIVTDWYGTKDSPAKLIADEYWNISIMDYDLIASKIKNSHVDGVITGFTDSYLLPYQHICELAGLPCYATKDVFERTMDKAKFKELCLTNNVPVIPEFNLNTFNPDVISPQNKIIIKPVDNSGSRGVVVCDSAETFQKCLDYALSFSQKKEVVIEKYMEIDSISASYTIQDGVLTLSTLNDRYVHKSLNGSAVTCLSIYPSKYIDCYMAEMNDRVCKMYKNLGVSNGILSVQFFTDGDNFYAMEMGHRLTGGQHYAISKEENGISSLDQLIHFSLTGKMADFDISKVENARFKHIFCHLYILGRSATIARIEGLEQLEKMPEIFHMAMMKGKGDKIGLDGTSAQKIIGLHLKVKDRAELSIILNEIEKVFHVYDEQGNDLVLKTEVNIYEI